jgi:DNA-binding NtrC family response regulator
MEENMTKQRLLIVDDEKNIRLTVRYTLEPLGFEVDAAVNGEEALEKLEAQPYDLVLLDLRMPGMEGLQVLRQIARRQPHTPVAIVTAHGTVENAVEAMKLGAIDFIRKPFSPNELRELVTTILERRQLLEEANPSYEAVLALTKHLISTRGFDEAMRYTRDAIGRDPARPEAFNLQGVIYELLGQNLLAQKNFRVALDLDTTYQPARQNLSRSVDHARWHEPLNLG